jgi:peptidoglycan/LPS O-acetylase OafA/YrhL
LISSLSEEAVSNNRKFGIDLARTLAISMVILVHTTGIGFGRFGVQLFFVISGYLLGDYYLKQSKKQFLVHRAFRLFPLSIIFIMIFYVNNMANLIEFILNATLIQNLFWNFYTFPGGWSISSEWLFSILLILFIPRYNNKLIVIWTFCCLLQITSGAYIYLTGGVNSSDSASQYIFKTWLNTTNPFINLGFFVSGILILMHKGKFEKINKYLLLIIPLIMILVDNFIGHFIFGWQFAIPAVFILLLRVKTRKQMLANLISFLGKRTYGMFFVHFLIWNNLNFFFNDRIYQFLTQNGLGKGIQFFFVYFFALLGGTITYRFIEKPFLNLSKKLKFS